MKSNDYPKAYLNKSGYFVVRQTNGYEKPLHRILVENNIGRPLKNTEQVHHKNGIKTDNRLTNLQVVTKSAHAILHRAYRDKKRGGKKYRILKCPVCSEVFARARPLARTKQKPCCSRSCANKLRTNTS